jgi:hypothetical protein
VKADGGAACREAELLEVAEDGDERGALVHIGQQLDRMRLLALVDLRVEARVEAALRGEHRLQSRWDRR